MLDPFTTGYLAGLATNVTASILSALGKRTQQAITGTPRQQALERCYQAALAAILPEDDPLRESYQRPLEDFWAEQAVAAELAKLVRGREPDLATLRDRFEEFAEERHLPAVQFAERLAAGVDAFVQVAEQEAALTDIIQTAQLRDATQHLRTLAADVEAIRRAVELARASTGDVTATGNIHAGNLVTGTQHIVNNYLASAGTWNEADYRAALGRYLEWLYVSMGKVVLRGIKSGGQQVIELSLHDVYVPLAAEALPDSRDVLKQGLGRLARRSRRETAVMDDELVAA